MLTPGHSKSQKVAMSVGRKENLAKVDRYLEEPSRDNRRQCYKFATDHYTFAFPTVRPIPRLQIGKAYWVFFRADVQQRTYISCKVINPSGGVKEGGKCRTRLLITVDKQALGTDG